MTDKGKNRGVRPLRAVRRSEEKKGKITLSSLRTGSIAAAELKDVTIVEGVGRSVRSGELEKLRTFAKTYDAAAAKNLRARYIAIMRKKRAVRDSGSSEPSEVVTTGSGTEARIR